MSSTRDSKQTISQVWRNRQFVRSSVDSAPFPLSDQRRLIVFRQAVDGVVVMSGDGSEGRWGRRTREEQRRRLGVVRQGRRVRRREEACE